MHPNVQRKDPPLSGYVVDNFYHVDAPCLRPPEHRVYTYDDSESPRGPAARPRPGPPETVGLLKETLPRPNQSGECRTKARKEQEAQEEQDPLKLSRCLSDPGPNKEDDLSR